MDSLGERRKKSIGSKTASLLVAQISNELYNHSLYMTFANYFALNGLDKLKDYYIGRAEEEIEHHRWIADRLNYADIEFSYPAINAIDIEIDDKVEPFITTVDAEIETTKRIYEIVNAAREEEEWETVYWLQELLVNEQTEEEHISRKYLKIAQQNDADWLTKADIILSEYQKSTEKE
ncbi:ferritin BfrB [Methanobrevibacter cuticularis]|uniref:Ferritin BfrB n=1 Tax=Methanobrevibacter cuticularis TaxID=47311 RepID=A0A166CZE0_9EURY|nr:ferritin-like domain-containing protein [Methanobrevibacter cuticularis]KZX15031.1 ferritin BfrB [Methanobrevibacter cuticularis]